MIAKYFLMGVLAPSFLNLIHLVMGIYVVMARGNLMSLGFSAMGFVTKTMGMIFLTWLGVSKMGLDWQIYVPILTFVWFMTHIGEAFYINHHMNENVSEPLKSILKKEEVK